MSEWINDYIVKRVEELDERTVYEMSEDQVQDLLVSLITQAILEYVILHGTGETMPKIEVPDTRGGILFTGPVACVQSCTNEIQLVDVNGYVLATRTVDEEEVTPQDWGLMNFFSSTINKEIGAGRYAANRREQR